MRCPTSSEICATAGFVTPLLAAISRIAEASTGSAAMAARVTAASGGCGSDRFHASTLEAASARSIAALGLRRALVCVVRAAIREKIRFSRSTQPLFRHSFKTVRSCRSYALLQVPTVFIGSKFCKYEPIPLRTGRMIHKPKAAAAVRFVEIHRCLVAGFKRKAAMDSTSKPRAFESSRHVCLVRCFFISIGYHLETKKTGL